MTNIVLNHKRAAELAIDHLAGLGHRHIALIKGQAFSSDTEPRWQAIQHAAAKANLRLAPELVAQLEGDSPSHEPGYFAAQRLLVSKEHFTALFAFNDVSAIGAIRAFREAALRIPQDISIVGFDDGYVGCISEPWVDHCASATPNHGDTGCGGNSSSDCLAYRTPFFKTGGGGSRTW